jgi:thioester reductase-like protein
MSNELKQIDELSPLQRALFGLKELRSKLDAAEQAKTEAIAVIGIGCRFPGGAHNPDAFWELLRHGEDAIQEVPTSRWPMEAYYDTNPDAVGKIYTRRGGFLDGEIDTFDAQFFGLAPREVISMDPQQRLLLEVCWEALEHSGQAPDRLMGSRTGVFVGITANDYAQRALYDDPKAIDVYTATGNALNTAAGRISYLLGWQGPAIALDTACSSSLVTVHLACQSLRSQDCHLALAGGINLMLSPAVSIAMSRLRALSADGRCKTFDANADGYGRAEGCGMVVLKRLSDAIADGDPILALIRGSAVNQDGRSSGLTVPNAQAQRDVIRAALANAKVEPNQIHYVEAHGTGTSLGDPIEVKTLGSVLGAGRSSQNPLMIGSVKTNIGHLESAAGIAGLIKVILSLQHQEIPPHLNFQQPSPHIDWATLPITIPTAPTPWRSSDVPRLAGVSSFAFSGTNAHVIVSEAGQASTRPPAPVPLPERPLHLLALSAKSEVALRQLAARYADHLIHHAVDLADLCFTANAGRSHFSHRFSLVADSAATLHPQLTAFATGQLANDQTAATTLKIAFLFPGESSQSFNLGHQLYNTQPIFRQVIDRCNSHLSPHLENSLLDRLFYSSTAPSPSALFVLQVAFAQLWQSWGIEPTAVMGDGVGEYAAACIAGVFSLEDGLTLLAGSVGEMPAVSTDRISFQRPRLGVISSQTGATAGAEIATADYWNQPIRAAEQSAAGLTTLTQEQYGAFVTMGDAAAFITLGQQSLPTETGLWLSSWRPGQNEWQVMLAGLAQLYIQGAAVDWLEFDRPYTRRKVSLPTYPFQRESYWIESAQQSLTRGAIAHQLDHPLLGQLLCTPLRQKVFESQFNLQTLPLMGDHRLYGFPVANLVIYLEMVCMAAVEVYGQKPQIFNHIAIPSALSLTAGETRPVQLMLDLESPDQATFQVFSLTGADARQETAWTLNCAGQVQFGPAQPGPKPAPFIVVQNRYDTQISSAEFYQLMRDRGADLGPTCQWLECIWRGQGAALGRVRVPQTPAEHYPEYDFPLGIVDACFQLLAASLPPDISDDYMMVGVESFRYYGYSSPSVWGEAHLQLTDSRETIGGNIRMVDDTGELVIEVVNAQLRRVNREMIHRGMKAQQNQQRPVSRSATPGSLSRASLLAMAPEQHQAMLETYLIEELARALQLPSDQLQVQQLLNSLVDSLITVELKNRIEADLQVVVPATRFFEDTTIAQLATFLREQLTPELASGNTDALPDENSGAMTVAALLQEAELSLDICPELGQVSIVPVPTAILLTGATGFIGAFLLDELLRQTDADIYCLVRATDSAEGKVRIQRNLAVYLLWDERYRDRIIPVVGDLAQPLLGLTTQQFQQLAEQMDAIYHCGAIVKWTYPYRALKAANVQGTREMIRLACQHRVKPLHFISTVGVFSSPEYPSAVVTEQEPLENSGTLYGGYAQSKWVAEKLVTIAGARGLPITIYRPNTEGHSQTGAFNPSDHLCLILKGCIQLGCAPQDLNIVVASAPIDYACQAMVYLSQQRSSWGQVFHIVNPEPLLWNDWMAKIRALGYPLRPLSYQDWRTELMDQIQQSQDNPKANELYALSPIFSDDMLDNARLPSFDCQMTLKALTNTAIVCPRIDVNLLQTYFSYFIRTGFLAAPPAGEAKRTSNVLVSIAT